MESLQAAMAGRTTTLALATLFVGTFVLGCAELLAVGMLNLIAADLGVSIPAAGSLVTVNALGLAIGGPILTALTIKLNRRAVLVTALVTFIGATLVVILTANLGLSIAARTLAGAAQGLFIAVAFAIATAIVPPERMGRAMSVVISGVAVSAALGVPLGTLIGQALGWRGAFAAIIGLAVVALVAAMAFIPTVPSIGGGAAGQARHAFGPRVIAVLALSFMVFAGLFAALTYIVPFLERVTGVSGALISAFLLAYGLATAIGSFVGGRFADLNAARALIIGTVGVAGSLAVLLFFGASAPLAALALFGLGLFGFGTGPSLQYRVVSLAGPGAQLASSLPASAINLGIAFGSAAGGLAVGGNGASAAVVAALVISATAIAVAWATRFLEAPVAEGPVEVGERAAAEAA